MKRIVLDVEDEVHTMIKTKASQEARSIRDILLELVERWLKKK